MYFCAFKVFLFVAKKNLIFLNTTGGLMMSAKRAVKFVIMWVCIALLFNAGIFLFEGSQKALEFLGGYMIEWSLSIDNLFLFLIVFSSFGIKSHAQRRALNYGIFGAIILRLVFILLGITVINKFEWILYAFGVILIISGAKMMFGSDEEINFEESKILKILRKILPVTDKLHGEKFFARENNKWHATPLLAIVILIEFSDIMFAIDSIPAVFSVSTDPFIVYTSNIFAIMGLRSMYFVIGKLHEKFEYVKYGVAAILTFTGIKLFVLVFNIHFSVELSLGVIFTLLVGSIIASVAFTSRKAA
jgi:tellurite resistance protein TerC